MKNKVIYKVLVIIINVILINGCNLMSGKRENKIYPEQSYDNIVNRNISNSMKNIIEYHLSGTGGIYLRGLSETTNNLPKVQNCDVVVLKKNLMMSDSYSYIILVDHEKRKYWIQKTGGFAGINQYFGPGSIDAVEKAIGRHFGEQEVRP